MTQISFVTISCAIKLLPIKKINKINTLFDKVRLILLIDKKYSDQKTGSTRQKIGSESYETAVSVRLVKHI